MFRTLFHTLQMEPSGLAVPQTTLPPFVQKPMVQQQQQPLAMPFVMPLAQPQPLAQQQPQPQQQQPNGIAPPDPLQAEMRAQEQKQWFFDLQNAKQKHQFKDDKASPLFYQRVDHAVCPTKFRMKGTMQQALEATPPLPTYEVKPEALFQFVTSPPVSFHDPNAIQQVLREPAKGVALPMKPIPRIQEVQHVESYPFCSDLADTLTAPFDRNCLQQLFRVMGGEIRGTAYPQDTNLHLYHSMGTLGAVKQYLSHLRSQTNSTYYSIQREAMMQFLGVTPEQLIRRAPYYQGVEVFWFVTAPGSPHRILGFLQRMIQPDIVHYYESSSPLINGMLQLTDIRLKGMLTCQVSAKDGAWIAVNQPAHIDHDIFHQDPLSEGRKGHEGLAVKMDGSPTPIIMHVKDTAPRVTRMYTSGLSVITSEVIHADKPIPAAAYSLTCEPRAPFLTYEVGPASHLFEELRNPGIFEQFQEIIQLEYHLHSVEREQVPGKKAFVRMNSSHSMIGLPNLAYQSWKTMTVAIRLRTMPIRDTLFHFMMGKGSLAVIIQKDGSLSIEHNLGRGGAILTVPTRLSLSINRWYLCSIEHNAYTFELRCDPMDGGDSTPMVSVSSQTGIPLYSPNAIWQTEPCHIMVGTATKRGVQGWNSLYSTSSFFYDLAWIHFFDRVLTKEDRARECQANWIYTAYPDVSGAYNT
jgi:hypothetical protein